MAENESNEVSVSKEDLAEAVEGIDEVAVETGVAGGRSVADEARHSRQSNHFCSEPGQIRHWQPGWQSLV